MNARKLNVTLLRGGPSAEREVSLKTGKQIAKALRSVGHVVFEADIGPDNLSALDRPCDLVFPALHGAFGEDGTLQKILKDRKIPFVGSGPCASRTAMDKVATKKIILSRDIQTPMYQVVHSDQLANGWNLSSEIGYPWVVKPIKEGSSIGVKICTDEKELRAHLVEMLPKYGSMMVEAYVKGRELTVGILDGKALPVIEIRPGTAQKEKGFYDYAAKYDREDTKYFFEKETRIEEGVLDKIRGVALETYYAVGCRHLARVDIIMDDRDSNSRPEIFVLEINTMPGFTTHSLLPMAAKKDGTSFEQLCDKLVHMAVEPKK